MGLVVDGWDDENGGGPCSETTIPIYFSALIFAVNDRPGRQRYGHLHGLQRRGRDYRRFAPVYVVKPGRTGVKACVCFWLVVKAIAYLIDDPFASAPQPVWHTLPTW